MRLDFLKAARGKKYKDNSFFFNRYLNNILGKSCRFSVLKSIKTLVNFCQTCL